MPSRRERKGVIDFATIADVIDRHKASQLRERELDLKEINQQIATDLERQSVEHKIYMENETLRLEMQKADIAMQADRAKLDAAKKEETLRGFQLEQEQKRVSDTIAAKAKISDWAKKNGATLSFYDAAEHAASVGNLSGYFTNKAMYDQAIAADKEAVGVMHDYSALAARGELGIDRAPVSPSVLDEHGKKFGKIRTRLTRPVVTKTSYTTPEGLPEDARMSAKQDVEKQSVEPVEWTADELMTQIRAPERPEYRKEAIRLWLDNTPMAERPRALEAVKGMMRPEDFASLNMEGYTYSRHDKVPGTDMTEGDLAVKKAMADAGIVVADKQKVEQAIQETAKTNPEIAKLSAENLGKLAAIGMKSYPKQQLLQAMAGPFAWLFDNDMPGAVDAVGRFMEAYDKESGNVPAKIAPSFSASPLTAAKLAEFDDDIASIKEQIHADPKDAATVSRLTAELKMKYAQRKLVEKYGVGGATAYLEAERDKEIRAMKAATGK